MGKVEVQSPNVNYTDTHIESEYLYQTTKVVGTKAQGFRVQPVDIKYHFRTERTIPKVGVMLVGWGGNNGSTFTAGQLANKHNINWHTKSGKKAPNFFGSIFESSTVSLGYNSNGVEQFVPFRELLPMIKPTDLIVGGWDISSDNLADAMARAEVLDYDLQRQLQPYMSAMKPRKAVYREDFIAINQKDRADNILHGTTQELLEQIRRDIKDFRVTNTLDKVIVLWTANTERFCDVRDGLNDTAQNVLNSIANNEDEVSASSIYAVASILEGCAYINGSPQNTFVPGIVELASQYNVFIGGDDFKSGQTKIKSVLVDFLVGAGIKPASIVSYNHLGNNDGMNLSAPKQFRSKEISKSNVVDDMVGSNNILYDDCEKPDHCVVIKYIPYVKDSKRALDEYTSEIFMHGVNTIVMHNTCEDSLLAVPIIFDLIMLTEMCQRISFRIGSDTDYQSFNSVLSILSYLLKAPLVPQGTPVVNALFKQRSCIENVFRACIGLPPQNSMMLEFKMQNPLSFKSNMKVQCAVSDKKHEMNGFIRDNEVTCNGTL